MINLILRGENIEVTEAIEDYAHKRFLKLEKYFDTPMKLQVNFKTYPSVGTKVEATLLPSYRAEVQHEDLYQAIDEAVDKLARQIRKHKTRLNRKARLTAPYPTTPSDDEESSEDTLTIHREKLVALKPMFPEEAALQMDLVDHDFFVFLNANTNTTDVVYKRHDGKYGLLTTDIDA